MQGKRLTECTWQHLGFVGLYKMPAYLPWQLMCIIFVRAIFFTLSTPGNAPSVTCPPIPGLNSDRNRAGCADDMSGCRTPSGIRKRRLREAPDFGLQWPAECAIERRREPQTQFSMPREQFFHADRFFSFLCGFFFIFYFLFFLRTIDFT
jgi:hypothetical protein